MGVAGSFPAQLEGEQPLPETAGGCPRTAVAHLM